MKPNLLHDLMCQLTLEYQSLARYVQRVKKKNCFVSVQRQGRKLRFTPKKPVDGNGDPKASRMRGSRGGRGRDRERAAEFRDEKG